MYRRVLAASGNNVQISAIAATETSGGSVAASTGTITFATSAAAAGSFRIFVGDEFCDVAVASGDTVTTIASNAVVAINNKTWWAVTATNSSGVITITSKQKGTRANKIRYAAVQQTGGAAVATTVTPGTGTYMTAGLAGSSAESWTTVLSTINTTRYYYIVPADDSSTAASATLSALVTQVGNQAQPVTGIRQVVVTGSVDTAANSQTLAQAINNARVSLVWLKDSELVPSELAATVAGIRALVETTLDSAYNFDFYPGSAQNLQSTWNVPAPRTQSSWPSRTNFKDALNSGVTPIGIFANGTTYLVKSVTTRCLNGSNFDYRTRSTHQVSVEDRFADDLNARYNARFTGKKLAADVPVGSQIPDASVVTPLIVKSLCSQLCVEYSESGKITNLQNTLDNLVCFLDTATVGRLGVRIQLVPIYLLDQIATQINDITPG